MSVFLWGRYPRSLGKSQTLTLEAPNADFPRASCPAETGEERSGNVEGAENERSGNVEEAENERSGNVEGAENKGSGIVEGAENDGGRGGGGWKVQETPTKTTPLVSPISQIF